MQLAHSCVNDALCFSSDSQLLKNGAVLLINADFCSSDGAAAERPSVGRR